MAAARAEGNRNDGATRGLEVGDGEARGGRFPKGNGGSGVDMRSENAVGGVIGDLGARAKILGQRRSQMVSSDSYRHEAPLA
jgi:hypothetical protein